MPSSEKQLFLGEVCKAFRDFGYRVDTPGTIVGSSGRKHEVDLLCYGNGGVFLLDVERDDDSVGVTPVLSLYAKAKDASARAVLIAVPNACPLAHTLSERYGLLLCEAKNPFEAISFVKEKVLRGSPEETRRVDHGILPVAMVHQPPYRNPDTYARRTKLRIIKSALELVVLRSAGQTSVTGYDTISLIHSKFGILLSPGTVYPVLKRLEEEGLIKSTETPRRRGYSLTPFGKLVVVTSLKEWDEISSEILRYLNSSISPLLGEQKVASHGQWKDRLNAQQGLV